MTATILLIRHAAHVELGKTLTGRKRDIALSKDGMVQASIVADLLGVTPLTAVYASPRERAWYTARAIAEVHEQKVITADWLDEVDFGDWTGRTYDSLEGDPDWDAWNTSRSTARVPGGESMGEAVARVIAGLEGLAATHAEQVIATVSHCDIIRGVIAHYLGLSLDHLLRFDVDTASVSRIVVGPWGGRVLSVNERLYQ